MAAKLATHRHPVSGLGRRIAIQSTADHVRETATDANVPSEREVRETVDARRPSASTVSPKRPNAAVRHGTTTVRPRAGGANNRGDRRGRRRLALGEVVEAHHHRGNVRISTRSRRNTRTPVWRGRPHGREYPTDGILGTLERRMTCPRCRQHPGQAELVVPAGSPSAARRAPAPRGAPGRSDLRERDNRAISSGEGKDAGRYVGRRRPRPSVWGCRVQRGHAHLPHWWERQGGGTSRRTSPPRATMSPSRPVPPDPARHLRVDLTDAGETYSVLAGWRPSTSWQPAREALVRRRCGTSPADPGDLLRPDVATYAIYVVST